MWNGKRIVRWMQTRWCNYACSYCAQKHSRHQVYRGSAGHWFDNAPTEAWLAAFDSYFSSHPTVFIITGGEPMLDRKHMSSLLVSMTGREYITKVRIDTNGSWDPYHYDLGADPKLEFMVSFHPEECFWDELIAKVKRIQANKLVVRMVTVVATHEVFKHLSKFRRDLRAIGVQLNVNSMHGKYNEYTEEEKATLRRYIPKVDLPQRTGANPHGKPCGFPAVAYEMYPDGSLCVGCHGEMAGNILKGGVPTLPESYVPCPHSVCVCLDKYTFLRELELNTGDTPLSSYSARLKELPMVE